MKDQDQKKNPQEESQNKKMRKLRSKRWFYPALYLCVVALIVSAVLWTQRGSENPSADKNQKDSHESALNQSQDDAVPVNGSNEVFQMPAADSDALEVVMPFYDVNGKAADQQKALVTYNNTTSQNTGVCLARKDGKTFNVEASMSGKVVKATKDPDLGYVVVLQHDNGVQTMYQSLAKLDVEKGEQVSQGQVLGTAGKNLYNAEAGVHVHFEIRKDDKPVNPESYFQKGLASLKDVKTNDQAAQVTSGTPEPSTPAAENSNEGNMENNKDNGTSSDQKSTNDDKAKDEQNSSNQSDDSSDTNAELD
ncbi:stage II sporulation protein Q [Pullulanibacillus pueri]|uniref:Stage II sporulation protein Q n=1 Tax=Pullulanibacillus pueri TaxID=1437324 RepID=A0A8J3EM99_9BACL|nr:M23 family metallopeptidase [Pullulanibacillus pueri]MBM7681743.1 stage II sporulation protein Q [Pullulanibacillus pueri]GGH84113.1 stage II sporulation protein Q [Pullulanibacillus pueri]